MRAISPGVGRRQGGPLSPRRHPGMWRRRLGRRLGWSSNAGPRERIRLARSWTTSTKLPSSFRRNTLPPPALPFESEFFQRCTDFERLYVCSMCFVIMMRIRTSHHGQPPQVILCNMYTDKACRLWRLAAPGEIAWRIRTPDPAPWLRGLARPAKAPLTASNVALTFPSCMLGWIGGATWRPPPRPGIGQGRIHPRSTPRKRKSRAARPAWSA